MALKETIQTANHFIKQFIINGRIFIFYKLQLPWLIIGFLLSRATILNDMTPFALPYFAVMVFLKKKITILLVLSIYLGTFTRDLVNGNFILMQVLLFFVIYALLDRKNNITWYKIPPIVFVSSLIIGAWQEVLLVDNLNGVWLTLISSSLLSTILTFIFYQALPILFYYKERYVLKHEEVFSMIIILASVMTGINDWYIYGISIENIISRYFILLFALAGGATIGASIGVITGLIISLANIEAIYQISLLSFSGLLAGLLKEGKKVGVGIGLLLGTTILAVYLDESSLMWLSFIETVFALSIFLLTPNILVRYLAGFLPGTSEYVNMQKKQIQHIQNNLNSKIEQFSELFQRLSDNLQHSKRDRLLILKEQYQRVIENASNITCQTCFRKSKCWGNEFYHTYNMFSDIMTEIELNEGKINTNEYKHCPKVKQVVETINQEYENLKLQIYWQEQIDDTKQLVSYQLKGIAQVLKDLKLDINSQRKEVMYEENKIRSTLEQMGIYIREVSIISLEKGKIEIELLQDNWEGEEQFTKIIVPLISGIIGENLRIKNRDCLMNKGMCKITLTSQKVINILTGIATVAKDGKWLSGDSHRTLDLGGRYAVALSDGMGNGEKALEESKTTLELIEQLLRMGVNESIAIKTVNSVLLLRSTEEMFATLDISLIDTFNAKTKFIKVGSIPTFIKRNNKIQVISANNLPVGILNDIDIDIISAELKEGDLLIMMTDGVYESARTVNNKELWISRLLKEITTNDPQEFADLLLEMVIRKQNGEIHDDMTVLVAKVVTYKPDWSPIIIPELTKLENNMQLPLN